MSTARQTRASKTGARVPIPVPVPAVKCAIYTRKSTSEGLDSDFNTLDAQREACEAYIQSQRSEGWLCSEEKYDDGGFSGGNMDRPAMSRLMTDIESGRVDCVVVYKVDRLSRSLLDFARLMDVFDKHNVSFVSVTQQFNTATSMGRLVLNVLLSFAQFEREIISERTSDKMCAARRKGKWLGGPPILGYDVDRERHRLVINPEEAEMVRELFDLYLHHHSMLRAAQEANRRGWSTKSYMTRKGVHKGGGRFDKAKLQRILTNITYTGKIVHKGKTYPGEQDAIIDKKTFDQVQEIIAGNGNGSGKTTRNKHGALLKGLLYCASCGAAMIHTYTKKKNRLYRYYICSTAQKQGREACPTPSLPAQEIEDFIVEQIRQLAADPEMVEQVFAEAEKQRQAKIPRLKTEQKRLQRERQHKQEKIKELVAAVGASSKPVASFTENLRELESAVIRIDQRLTEIKTELTSINRKTVDKADVTAALSTFGPVWDELYPAEKTRIVNLLIERVEYDAQAGELRIRFHADYA
ncbi:recombinase family protein [Candidatus Zixiibacteriota bacterium]